MAVAPVASSGCSVWSGSWQPGGTGHEKVKEWRLVLKRRCRLALDVEGVEGVEGALDVEEAGQ